MIPLGLYPWHILKSGAYLAIQYVLYIFLYFRGATLDVFNHDDAVYGLSVDPLNDNVFASACDDGRILIYDIRAPPSEGKTSLTIVSPHFLKFK